MEYLKLFDTETNYLTYRNDKSKYLKPNVSLSDDNGKIFYNLKTNGHEFVDLGLPSGTLWATCNVGASKPTSFGLYFQWGDVQGYTFDQVGKGDGKKKFASDWSDYKWSIDGSSSNFSEYTTLGESLELEDDAAHVHMGGDWHIPTPEQLKELIDNTTTGWTSSNGGGCTFTSTKDNSKSIFIPAAGGAWDGSVGNRGSNGVVWSSMLRSGNVSSGQLLGFDSGHAGLGYGDRYGGCSVRGVLG